MLQITLSDSDDDDSCTLPKHIDRGRRNIREIKRFDDLSAVTKAAHFVEIERITRINLRCEEKKRVFSSEELSRQLILDFDDQTRKANVVVHEVLVRQLKQHQKDGILFMWNACFETVKRTIETPGHGCILAHCMGLGKTLQVISLCHTVLNHPLQISKVLILCPKNTVLNWGKEFHKWIIPPMPLLHVYNPTRFENSTDRLSELQMWTKFGGVCIMNYDLFRLMLENSNGAKDVIRKILIDPGPDVIICDEGHIIKSDVTKVAKVLHQIRTARRIVLTGTPLQNNLMEYFSLIQFIRPHLLGTKAEFRNMFFNPIGNGQYEDSLREDVNLMKERSHVLHKTLASCVQRFDYSTLAAYLPKKYEYVLTLRLTKSQIDMYHYFLSQFTDLDLAKSNKMMRTLFRDYQLLQRVWTHPFSLKLYDDASYSNTNLTGSGDSDDETYYPSRLAPGWWETFIDPSMVLDYRSSAKMVILFEIIKQCGLLCEKLLVFSGSLFSLRMIEYLLQKTTRDDNAIFGSSNCSWDRDEDYFFLSGETSMTDRYEMCEKFNNTSNAQCRLFLISTKAGGIGINLTAANRAVIFDASWNPSYDIQSIFRIYRLGQNKTCFVYRLLASGTMEEKIYERQVTKQSTSHRVVDEKQIARHYSLTELKELYELDPDKLYVQPSINVQDNVMETIIEKFSAWIGKFHEHDSLLQHELDEELREIEKNKAFFDFSKNTGGLTEKELNDLQQMTSENFRQSSFKEALRQKYPVATESVIVGMMNTLMPKVNRIIQQPNFRELMLREAMNVKKQLERNCDTATRGPKRPVPINSWGKIGGVVFGDPLCDDSD